MKELLNEKLKAYRELGPVLPEARKWLEDSNLWMLLYTVLCQRGVERRGFNAHAIPVGHKPCRSRVVDMAVSEQQAFHLKLVAVDKRHHLVAFLRAHHARINNYGMMCRVVPQDIDILAKQIHFETGYIHNGRYTTFLVLK